MITAPTASFYMIRTEGETAGNVLSSISPSVAADIATAVLTSADFEIDMLAVSSMRECIGNIKSSLHNEELKTEERFNPIYVPSKTAQIDEMLNTDPRTEGMKFVGMNGNPYTLNILEIKLDGKTLISGKVDYKPFDIPVYSEIISIENATLN